MKISALDHFVLTVKDVNCSIKFYTQILGMKEISFEDGRKAVKFGSMKINFHQLGKEVKPNALNATVGSADICLLTTTLLEDVLKECKAKNVDVISDIVKRTGAKGAINSIYLRDPDGNLIEISQYI
ncbi:MULTISPECIES: VOC family protein [Campylobacter]|uniref:VOC family protein n=1 Tax=Campylobacter TaxID=194 RepID=UPI001472FEAB|nr:VOC family protein [Campylobacter sp. RM12916]MBE3022742.1 VOC family protein [Campylobacter sp. 7477a]MBE3610451.1 VOC family protein [Campylobacter sp. RM12916]